LIVIIKKFFEIFLKFFIISIPTSLFLKQYTFPKKYIQNNKKFQKNFKKFLNNDDQNPISPLSLKLRYDFLIESKTFNFKKRKNLMVKKFKNQFKNQAKSKTIGRRVMLLRRQPLSTNY
jgi:hypothetical protein